MYHPETSICIENKINKPLDYVEMIDASLDDGFARARTLVLRNAITTLDILTPLSHHAQGCGHNTWPSWHDTAMRNPFD